MSVDGRPRPTVPGVQALRPRTAGPASVAALAGVLAVMWCAVGPADGDWSSLLGQLAGAEAVLLMSCAVVLVSGLPAVEAWFSGMDAAMVWHRRLAGAGMVLLMPHIALASAQRGTGQTGTGPSQAELGDAGVPWGGALAQIGFWGLTALVVWAIQPRWRTHLPWRRTGGLRASAVSAHLPAVSRAVGALRCLLRGYERWWSLHRLSGLFLTAGFVHGLLDGTMFASGLLRWTYLAIGGIGLSCYLYRETIARFVIPVHDYQITTVTHVSPGLVELALSPLGKPLRFVPGQFAMLSLDHGNGRHPHPFTIASSPDEGVLRFAIKALGDDTTAVEQSIRPGALAGVSGPHGRFDRSRGTARQIWIAGGIGITPFLSWIRSLGSRPLRSDVDFFYSTRGQAPFAAEILDIAARHDNLRVHLHDSATHGALTADAALAVLVDSPPREVSVFLCGPTVMVDTMVVRFRAAGVPPRNLHREHFTWR